MSRKPTVRYFASRDAYYCQHLGKQHKLGDGPDDSPSGPNYMAALDAYKQLMQLGAVDTARDRNSVRTILESYLAHIAGRRSVKTFRLNQDAFLPFCKRFGEVAVGDLKPHAIEAFLQDMRKPRPSPSNDGRRFAWGDASVAIFVNAMSAAFRWAVKKKLVTVNPVEGIDRPPRRSRSRKCLVNDEQHGRILAGCRTPGFRALVVCLHATGARPGELLAAEAKDWNDQLRALVYYGDDRRRQDEFRHKNAGRAKDRVIYFAGESLAVVRELMRKYPTGPLFRTLKKGPWTTQTLGDQFRVLRKRLQMPDLIAYSYRHTFATNWLKAGRSVDILAELLGNTPETIRRHYSHLCGDRPAVRRQLEEFFAGPGAAGRCPLCGK